MGRIISTFAAPAVTRRLMIFIDGGYLRKGVNKIMRDAKADKRISYRGLRDFIVSQVAIEGLRPELIRAYYYDGRADPLEQREKYMEQEKYFAKIQSKKSYELRLGRQIKTKDGDRQKGVDILLTLDMLSKGFLKHYDIAAFVGGDDDFLDLISAVKNLAGRRVFGFYFSHNISPRLRDSFDVEIVLDKVKVRNIMVKKKILRSKPLTEFSTSRK
jgi:uncharacterized LabA/DUF88 family protein